jgi:hypothetical protein
VASGYVAVSQGWRWSFWWCTIFLGIISLAMVFLLEETKYSTVVLNGHPQAVEVSGTDAKALEYEDTKDKRGAGPQEVDAASPYDSNSSQRRRSISINYNIPMKSYRERMSLFKISPGSHKPFFGHFLQPFVILFRFPAVTFAALQYGFCLSALAILAITQAVLFPSPPYNFSPIGVGNLGIPQAIGSILGSIYGGVFSDYYIIWRTKRNGGIYEPEMRLDLFILPGLCMPAGILLYGLTTAKVRITPKSVG